MVEDYLRSAESHVKPLRETDGLTDAIQHVGGTGNGLFGYENQREQMRSFFAALKNDPNSTPGADNRADAPVGRQSGRLAGFFAPARLRPGGQILLLYRL